MTHALKDYTVAPAPTFGLPDDAERKSLSLGQYAKVVFALDVTVELGMEGDGLPPPDGERMWVQVIEVLGDGRYKGRLENEPLYAGTKYGAIVEFTWQNVISIMEA